MMSEYGARAARGVCASVDVLFMIHSRQMCRDSPAASDKDLSGINNRNIRIKSPMPVAQVRFILGVTAALMGLVVTPHHGRAAL